MFNQVDNKVSLEQSEKRLKDDKWLPVTCNQVEWAKPVLDILLKSQENNDVSDYKSSDLMNLKMMKAKVIAKASEKVIDRKLFKESSSKRLDHNDLKQKNKSNVGKQIHEKKTSTGKSNLDHQFMP